MSEIINSYKEFEQRQNREIEQTYLPLFPERLERFRRDAVPIEQLYLSHPTEEFSLRLRETLRNGELVYSAALKDRGTITSNGLDRLEVETTINSRTYEYYKQREHVLIRKLRATPSSDVAIDWFEDGHVHVESEQPLSWATFQKQYGLEEDFVDISGDRTSDSEWRAHLQYRRAHHGTEALVPCGELDPGTITAAILQHQRRSDFTVATIAGRSGSGKSTVVGSLQQQLAQSGIDSLVLSTDDYHRGKTWLEEYKGSTWTDWDAPIVYDIEALQADIERLRQGNPITRRRFDFDTEEPTHGEVAGPVLVVLVEGIYARDPSLDAVTDLRYELPTPLATCVGRRLLRDLRERPQFAELSRSLRYILEQAEPHYRDAGVVD